MEEGGKKKLRGVEGSSSRKTEASRWFSRLLLRAQANTLTPWWRRPLYFDVKCKSKSAGFLFFFFFFLAPFFFFLAAAARRRRRDGVGLTLNLKGGGNKPERGWKLNCGFLAKVPVREKVGWGS